MFFGSLFISKFNDLYGFRYINLYNSSLVIVISDNLIESFIPKGDVTFEFKIFFIIEKNKLDTRFIIYWVLSSICLAAMTSLSPLYIRKYQATMFNISLTFTIFWSYIIKSFFIEDISKFKWYWLNSLYFVGFIIIIAGTVIFSWKDRIRKNNFGYA